MFRFGSFFYAVSPKGYKKWVERHIDYCNLDVSPIKLIGFFTFFSIGIGFAAGFLAFTLLSVPGEVMLAVWAGGFVVAEIIMHVVLLLIADSRANFVETILPDALQIISSNLRSGLTPDKAILTSARPEFGPLENELRKVSKETLSGKPFDESLRGITKKIKSRVLEKTVDLLVEGLAKGGSLTTLLDSIAEDVRQVKLLRGEIKSFVTMYGIFIFFAAAIGAPILYSVSTYMVQTLTTLGGQIGTEDVLSSVSTSLPLVFKFKNSAITPDFLLQYSTIALTVTSIFGSLLIGLVQDGTEKSGIKFIPVLLGMSLGIFFGSQLVLKYIFSAFTG